MILLPAYGRKPETKEQVCLDWHNGLDFKILNGPYCSIRDFEQMQQDFDTISLMYGDGRFVTIHRHIFSGLISR